MWVARVNFDLGLDQLVDDLYLFACSLTMALRIRLSLRGCLNRPFYHIVVAHGKRKRDGKHLEQVSITVNWQMILCTQSQSSCLRRWINTCMHVHLYLVCPRVQVGCYDPMPNSSGEVVVGLNFERIKWVIDTIMFRCKYLSYGLLFLPRYWLSVGAQPTVPVYKLLGLVSRICITLAYFWSCDYHMIILPAVWSASCSSPSLPGGIASSRCWVSKHGHHGGEWEWLIWHWGQWREYP